jgi:spore germination cell wall hydrolase CwlJ-like protein
MLATSAAADEVLTRDERVIALTILGEARGEGKIGMYAVACVIQKRSEERNLTLAKVCQQKWQFSIWNGTDRQGKYRLKRESELYYLWKSKEMMYARELARALSSGKKFSQKVTGGANHYCTLNTNNKYTRMGTGVKIIGHHKFYILK